MPRSVHAPDADIYTLFARTSDATGGYGAAIARLAPVILLGLSWLAGGGLNALFAVGLAAGKLVPELSSGASWPYELLGVGYSLLGDHRSARRVHDRFARRPDDQRLLKFAGRHEAAIAAERGKEWPDDTKRPLTERGIARFKGEVAGLEELSVEIEGGAIVARPPSVTSVPTNAKKSSRFMPTIHFSSASGSTGTASARSVHSCSYTRNTTNSVPAGAQAFHPYECANCTIAWRRRRATAGGAGDELPPALPLAQRLQDALADLDHYQISTVLRLAEHIFRQRNHMAIVGHVNRQIKMRLNNIP